MPLLLISYQHAPLASVVVVVSVVHILLRTKFKKLPPRFQSLVDRMYQHSIRILYK